MKDEYVYRIQFPIYPFTEKIPLPSVSPDDIETRICVEFSYQWLPILLGAVKVLKYDDMWIDGGELSVSYVEKLLRRLMNPVNCEGSMTSIDIRLIDLGAGCQQVQKSVGGAVWENIGLPICSGASGREIELVSEPSGENCYDLSWRYSDEILYNHLVTICDGAAGMDGADGAAGMDGADGADCECNDPVPVQPPVVEGDDRCQTACNIAFGLGAYFHQKFNDTLNWAEAAFEATDIIADLVSDFIEAFPVLGAIVDAIVQYVENWSEADIASFRSANTEELKERIQCKLYEVMANDSGDFTADYLSGVRTELATWMLTLPPQGPLLIVIGQAYSLMLALFTPNELLRRANVYKDNAGDCELCDVECGCSVIDFPANVATERTIVALSDVTKTYRITMSGTSIFKAVGQTRCWFYRHDTGAVFPNISQQFIGFSITTPAHNSQHLFTFDVQGNGAEWKMKVQDSDYGDNSAGTMKVEVCIL